jgi:GNAT superfamily N-acetyltransferase
MRSMLRYRKFCSNTFALDNLTREMNSKTDIRVRRVRAADIPQIIALDARVTKLAKADYWNDVFDRYGRRRLRERFFLVAERPAGQTGLRVVGFIIGEIRAWEFGSSPCGWIFALSVEPKMRLRNIATALFGAIADEFKKAGIDRMRTMVANDARLPLLFFRSQGMRAGPYIQLEKYLE